MKHSKLVDVLVSLGVSELESAEAWRRVVLVRNMSAAPAQYGTVPWGFKFIVLDTSGNPAWFGRCGWATTERMRVECELLDWLGRDSFARCHVPEARYTFVGTDAVQISRHLGNAAYSLKMSGRSPQRWVLDVSQILATAESILGRVQEAPEGSLSVIRSVPRIEQVAADCEVLRRNKVQATRIGRIESILLETAGDVPFLLQHGDLWPANILEAQGRWWLIDFSECGLVWTPGYDLFMLLANSPGGFSTQWIGSQSMDAYNEWDQARLRIVHEFASRHGWTSHQVGIMLLHFLLRLTAYRMRPGVSAELSAYWRDELLRIESLLAAGRSPAELIQWNG